MKRTEYANFVVDRLVSEQAKLTSDFRIPGRIQSFSIDELLPPASAEEIYSVFPKTDQMEMRKTLKEHKYIAAQMNRYSPILEEIVYAFQDPRVVEITAAITGIDRLVPDPHLYAGGLSVMERNHFLNPHLDNSHDKDRKNYRVLNLL